ncbi:MAG: UTP--glucose-1-phosphate uridylyltransferase [Zetaproteobacteria bacterium CG12_big_fil_rev_8_21_14_0_65_55_1124]|nr:MAG: UTP--glucose-1-phosphate uridylyltransferase [Zetaproteobacteria bacterium CG1_02_55_237]PIS18823.1 MAG: UTP--glucose-1-phosphate uridylyltransferase [Zetaproteobacteria bacterium CG08_land_8_20_14_0_20_55_17]PIW43939.1 MAG: UTP--glucose-1-phosphate uridylyltransferase [Zetaproteobacteria bacterium CG12_big_fil_rev_8_21_14_0_65_55_1124]PIY54504.1 MAG: UTP--glucose-1-phosphate uridylyltransferase [Zetaproteobacteria bacterium CG_4_10_14_0_8_um_filter_55_43]PIZ38258.1 MAG: UTP--glucose-1-
MIRKCLFPVAGYGTRFLPATKAQPKEMLPVVTTPLIQYGVEEALQAGMSNMAFVTGRNKRAIEDHFDVTYELEDQISGTSKELYLKSIRLLIDQCTFTYVRQTQMRGLGDAVLTGEPLIGNQPFGVILADDLCYNAGDGVMGQMAKLYEQYRCSIVAIEEVPAEDVSKYGIISGDEMDDGLIRINGMVEKPSIDEAPSNLAVIGRYILTPDIFDILRATPKGKGGEVQLTDALMEQAREGRVIGYRFKGRRFDCGSIEGFIEATNFFFEHVKPAN